MIQISDNKNPPEISLRFLRNRKQFFDLKSESYWIRGGEDCSNSKFLQIITVTNFKIVETDVGETYVRLILEGDLEMILSEKTGNFYAHTKRYSISSTFDAATAEKMIG